MKIKSYNAYSDVLDFGKYQGIRLGRVMEIDPQWIIDEEYRNGKFFVSAAMIKEATESLTKKKAAR